MTAIKFFSQSFAAACYMAVGAIGYMLFDDNMMALIACVALFSMMWLSLEAWVAEKGW